MTTCISEYSIKPVYVIIDSFLICTCSTHKSGTSHVQISSQIVPKQSISISSLCQDFVFSRSASRARVQRKMQRCSESNGFLWTSNFFFFFYPMHQKSKFLGISSSPSFVDVCWFWRVQAGVLITLLHDCAQGTQFKRKYLAGQSLVWKISSSLKGFMPFVTRCQVQVNIWQGKV